ncbi:hypothetical protein BJV85_003127 [Clostridium acetobutylicum]|uniref:DUF1836 domain-containing protein n=1 Tax=Clostridium acetobutylicum (strain ATCC 824 / DSM 792 / JCM 1419 / IAM 19013 / LMG 5710 / NBRC 13948 / NRRL B-527 / VKM B-1787 / 2291 / W) TaxID=272562 RepID=Q97KN6_CLOAB|nr:MULTISPECIES: DUF1836 domain-containing protein [Clostridium]AAK78857.1 Hypothetical protein CA_C0881 [Clostridium acetobutylicum ATCC 824]ADZ19932.1 Conserved hypothetical protein [Clostridium acetobutylicum EA 2018]AEI31486.1 hypothetical protein SMB_G0898 [Clostridium acetobutylicum DSM 1731]AWV80576.1 DUF1836 domain-containing protein [Clostridium acetobutylicum]MBC2392766.1 DUF1836 domain-containing protein [Clostridium acetobutylicum]
MNDEILELAKQILDYTPIKNHEIPDIDLYMDQVTSFMENKLKAFKRSDDDIILTKTMINNYTKNKLIAPPIKKKYSKENMMMLIFIYHLKQTLSIGDIGDLLNFMVSSTDGINIDDLYDKFLLAQKNSSASFIKGLDDKLNFLDKTNTEDKTKNEQLFLLISELILSANIQKRMAEKIIDCYFKDSDNKK